MTLRHLYLVLFFFSFGFTTKGQTVSPTAYYKDKDGNERTETMSIDDAQAPLDVEFRANPSGTEGCVASYEWHFRHTGLSKENRTKRELFVRYEENTNYTFTESGEYEIVLKTFLQNNTGIVELDSGVIKLTISESKLEFPNAFSPNGDGTNDIYRAKPEYKNIISFRAIIFNRWGQKLYEWSDPASGWDGKYNGKDVKEGIYFVLVEAKGADGKEYQIKRDVNLLRGFSPKENVTGGIY